MGMGVAFASAFFGELNDKKRAQAAAQREAAIKADERQAGYDLATFKAGLDEGNIKLEAKLKQEQKTREFEQGKPERLRQQYIDQLEVLSEDQRLMLFQDPDFLKGYNEVFGTSITSEMAGMANALNDIDSNFFVGSIKFRNPSKDLSTANVYNKGYGTLDNIDQQLGNPEFFDSVVEKAKGDQVTRDSLVGLITRAEQQLIEGYGILQTQKEVTPGKVYTTSIDNFSNIARLHEALNSQPEREAAQTEIAGKIANTPDGFTPLVFTVSTDEVGTKQGLVRNISTGDQKLVAEMAAKHGQTTQQFVDSFAVFRDIPTVAEFQSGVYLGMDDDEIVDEQYAMFNNVLEMQRRGYGEILNNPLAASPEKKQEIAAFLREKYGDDRFRMSVALGYMLPTDQMFLAAPQTGMFYTPETKKTGKQVNGRSFLKNELGYTDKQIQEVIDGFEYSKQTVDMLTQLKDLELGVLADAQGFSRELKRVLLGAGTQLKQAGGVLKDVFVGNDIFNGNYKDGETNSESLMATAERLVEEGVFKLEKGSTLADISEADALKLALAARMARAIDPSGRLSNQDFEIQLRRLGGALLGDAESVKRQLNLLLTEFNGNIRRNSVIATAASVGQKIDAVTARAIRADRMLETTFVGFSTDTYQPRQAPAAAAAEVSATPEVDMKNYVPITDENGNETGMFARIGGGGPEIINADGKDVEAAYMGTDNTAGQGTN